MRYSQPSSPPFHLIVSSFRIIARKYICHRKQQPHPVYFSSSSSSSSTSIRRTFNHDNLVLYNSLNQLHQPLFPPYSHETKDSSNTLEHDSVESKGLMWYTCGPTVYDSAHIGHARTYVCLDIIHRLILHKSATQNQRPIFIMNITNVDDKILQRAKELQISPYQLVQKYEEEFWKDMDDLHVMRPTLITRVTEHVESTIIPYIQTLMDKGIAYRISTTTTEESDSIYTNPNTTKHGSSIYFDVQKFETMGNRRNRYGKLSMSDPSKEYNDASDNNNNNNNNNNTFFSWHDNETTKAKQSGIQKRDVRDFVLWKSRLEGQEDMLWNSPWGYGRPGWHIECSAMIDYCVQKVHKILLFLSSIQF